MFYWITKHQNNPYQILLSCVAAQRFAFGEHGAGAGVASAWEQKKPEARKLLDAKRAAESPASYARNVGQF